jgi:hypothetical protein
VSAVLDPLGLNLEEVISSLPTEQERDELSVFIEEHLKRGTGAGILRGLFLLLKANRCYMEKLPGQFNRELVQPIIENMLRLETSIGRQIESQEKILTQTNRCVDSSTRAADRMEAVVPKVEGVVQKAFDRIDSSKLTQKVEDSVMEGVVKPITKINHELETTLPQMQKRSEIVNKLMEKTTWYNVKLFFLNCASAWGIVFFCLYLYGYFGLSDWYKEKLAAKYEQIDANAQANQQAYAKLTGLNVTIEVVPQGDAQGNVVPGHYALTMKGADDAQLKNGDDGQAGVIFFQGRDFGTTIDSILRKNQSSFGH